MRFGVDILNFSDGATPESLLSRATTAESLGFHSALLSDHVAITPGVRPRYPEPFYDVFTTLAWLAGQTSQIQLGTTVCVVPYRHPVLIARLVANIDQLSGGRFILGVAAGGAQDEFAALGVPFNRRGAITNEYLEIIHELWAHEEVTYEGRFVTLDQVSGIKPFAAGERVRPPVWVGGRSDAAMRRAVRFNADWHPNSMTASWLRDQGMPRLHKIAIEMGGRLPALVPRMKVDLRDQAIDDEGRLLGQGSLDQVRGDLELLDELGAEHVVFDWYIPGNMETARDDARAWRMLSLLAEQAIDLQNERLR
jgi:probable F420-dependent oxidoreductase